MTDESAKSVQIVEPGPDPSAETIDDLGLIMSSIYADGDDGADHDELYARLGRSLGGPTGRPPAISEARRHEIRALVEAVEELLAVTNWTPDEFRDAVDCHHCVGELYAGMNLSRCLALLRLLLENTKSDATPEQARVTAEMTVEAFRLAAGDPQLTSDFWSKPMRSDHAAREYVASGDLAGAMRELSAHAAGMTMDDAVELPESLLRRKRVSLT